MQDTYHYKVNNLENVTDELKIHYAEDENYYYFEENKIENIKEMLIENQKKTARLEKAISEKEKEIEIIKGNALKKFEVLEKTLAKSSTNSLNSCKECSYKTNLDHDLEQHIRENHVKILNCEFCDFVGKTEGGLKTHMRKKHTRNVRNWSTCSFCNFSSKYESEMIAHLNKFKYTHIIEKINEYTYQMNQEIAEMKKDGYMLNCLVMTDF